MYNSWCVFLALTVLVHPVDAQQQINCTSKINSCTCQTDEGIIDLSPLDAHGLPHFQKVNSSLDRSYMYSYNPCSDFPAGNWVNNAVCQVSKPGGDVVFSLGPQGSAEFVTDELRGLEIQYHQYYYPVGAGVKERRAHVQLQCAPDVEKVFVANGEDQNALGNYYFVLISKYACPGGGGPTRTTRHTHPTRPTQPTHPTPPTPVTPPPPVSAVTTKPRERGDNVQVNVLVNTGVINWGTTGLFLAAATAIVLLFHLASTCMRKSYRKTQADKIPKFELGERQLQY